MKKKIFAVSDVHGHYTLLKKALDEAGFDENNEDHLLVACGDYFDRGDENVEVLRFFEKLNNAVLLRGNHEDMLLKMFDSGYVQQHNFINGTFKTLENFFGKYCVNPLDYSLVLEGHTRALDRLCDFINGTIDYYETKNYVFVHGWILDRCFCSEDLKTTSKDEWAEVRWKKWTEFYKGARPLSDKTLVCGHMPVLYAYKFDSERDYNTSDIFYGEGVIAIDAGTIESRRVNVLVIEDELM